jgi:ubiquinone/menaquinone biosynthesis C-methylase UbiE
LRECEHRFQNRPHASFAVGNGEDLPTIESGSIDGVWSFDVFVHINKAQFNSYVAEFARVLKPGGVGLLHHGSSGGTLGGWRSDVTTSDVSAFLRSHGLLLERQVQDWEDDGQTFEAGLYQDTITCFRKALRTRASRAVRPAT